jgi:hypothetical protein
MGMGVTGPAEADWWEELSLRSVVRFGMSLLLILLLALIFIPARAARSAERAFVPAGRTPAGDYNVTVQLAVDAPARVAGKIYLARRDGGPSVGIDLEGGKPRLFVESAKRTAPASEAAPLGQGAHVLVARRRGGPDGVESFALELNGRFADALYVACPSSDEVEGVEGNAAPARGSVGHSGVTGAKVGPIVARRVEEPFFDDEFTWDEEETGAWRPGSGCWELSTTRDAWIAVDRGPFATSSYRARPAEGAPAMSLADIPPTGRIHVTVAAFLPEGGEAGIAFSVAKRGKGAAFGAILVTPGPDGEGTARLVAGAEAGRGNGFRELAPPTRAYVRAEAWTSIEIWADWDWVRAAVGGRLVLEAETSDLPSGRVGLVAARGAAVLFDDFRVRPWHVVRERVPGERISWSRPGAPGHAGVLLTPELTAWASGFRLETHGGKGAPAPVPVPVSGGTPRSIWEPEELGRPTSLAVDVSGPHVIKMANGKTVDERVVGTGAAGADPERFVPPTPGVLVPPGASLPHVIMEPSTRPLEVDLFASDFTVPYVKLPFGRGVLRLVGDRLAPTSGKWRCYRASSKRSREGGGDAQGNLVCDAPGLGAIWLPRPCPGDARLEAEIALPAKPSFRQAGVVLAGDPRSPRGSSRYTLAVEHTLAGDTKAPEAGDELPRARLVLRRTADEVASCPLPEAAEEAGGGGRSVRLALERRGTDLIACLDGRPVFSWRDGEPLTDDGAGLFAVGGRATFKRASVRHLRATRSDFRSVAPEWQPLSGEWRPHTGLSCIPWDHWITAFGAEDDPAYLGLLREPVRDVCLATRISEAGEGFENRTHVHYPMHDISVTLRGRLDAARSAGYRFLFAPLPAKRGIILFRDGLEVASSDGFATWMGDHHNEPRQFTVVVRAVGARVSCEIDGRQVLEWTDPVPLPAGEVILGSEKGRVNFADVTVMDVRIEGAVAAALPTPAPAVDPAAAPAGN